jgi:hypothetical protein
MKILFMILFITIFDLFGQDFTRTKNTIIDDNSKKMWQDTKDNKTLQLSHEKAASYCEDLKLDGYTNWRLPTIDEYKAILDYKRKKYDTTLPRAFRNAVKKDYWTNNRTWNRNFGLYGYYLVVKSGSFYYQNRTYKKYVRCIRNIQ